MAREMRRLLVIVGPTASGKTELAVRLAEAIGGEVVGADSVQVYRRFDIGTGKPSAEERARAPHHLVDVVEPLEPMDAAQWALRAEGAIDDIIARGKTPLVCGGAFLWVRSLLFGLAPTPTADTRVRERHRVTAEAQGRAALHAELARVDPETAARLAPNDFVRVSRALEVHELTGVPQSQWHAQHGFREPRYEARLVGVQRSPDELSARISERVAAMLRAGWIDEVQALLADGFGAARAMRSVGYRQIADALENDATAELAEKIVRATRIFARRQRTWLRDEPVEWIAPDAIGAWIQSAAQQDSG
jgi:tRNA dimethylallyltransferase